MLTLGYVSQPCETNNSIHLTDPVRLKASKPTLYGILVTLSQDLYTKLQTYLTILFHAYSEPEFVNFSFFLKDY